MLIINYHQISKSGDASVYDLPLRLFEAQIDALVDEGFSFVTFDELLKRPSDDQSSQCAICFDDGRTGAYEHGFRILSERGLAGTYFICPDWIERPPTASVEAYSGFMAWEQIADLARHANVIGSHGKSHVRLPDLDAPTLQREVVESKTAIEQKLGVSCDHFAAPWGDADARVIDVVRSCGYATLSSTVQGPNKAPYQLFRLRRIDGSLLRSPAQFRQVIARHVRAHRFFEVVLLRLQGTRISNTEQLKAMAAFDLAVCLDAAAYALCLQLAMPCERGDAGSHLIRSSESLRERHQSAVGDREVTFTELTLRERRSPWTYLSSFLPGTSARR